MGQLVWGEKKTALKGQKEEKRKKSNKATRSASEHETLTRAVAVQQYCLTTKTKCYVQRGYI